MREGETVGMPYKVVRTCRREVLASLYLGLIVAGMLVFGCAVGSAGGPPAMSLAECMGPPNPLPWWQTYPCNLINGSEGP